MKRAAVIFILLFSCSVASLAQNDQNELELFDELSGFNCEDLLSRLDAFWITGINRNANAAGYVLIYDNGNQIDNKFLERYIETYRALRDFDKNRFVILTAKGRRTKRIEFWISPNRTIAPKIEKEDFSFTLPKTEKPILFVEDWVEIIKWNGKLQYSSYCPACCIDGLNLYFLSEFLKANRHLTAQINIRGKSRFYTKPLEQLVRSELIKDYQISPNRFRISYRGRAEGIAQLPINNVTIEIELVTQK